ncbi:MAG: peptidylprolyl isomerase [Cryomorphaceae bacterium]|jgi:peptidylprolyl isomerase|nr:peptidylprolyl isomerase [Cryomorphaceae bacterium]
MKKLIIILILIAVVSVSGCGVDKGTSKTTLTNNDPGDVNMEDENNKIVLLKTNMGDIKIEMASDMPITTGNFVGLVEKGTYDGVIFHRIIDGFMIQGGDPTGTGMGDPSIPNIKGEFGSMKNNVGTISMANTGDPDTGSSQFFINLINNNRLDGVHPVFGKVISGMDVVEKIAKVQTGPGDRPLEDVIIEKAEVMS